MSWVFPPANLPGFFVRAATRRLRPPYDSGESNELGTFS